MTESPHARTWQALRDVYGPSEAQAIHPRVEALVRAYTRTGDARSLDERDALLITYADQVWQAGVPPLESLAAFLETHLAGLLSGVHILPFYPSSSDDGFSVIDYDAVDPSFGTWSDVERIGRRFDMMFDAVVNHASAQSAMFRGYLAGDAAYRDYFINVAGDPDLSRVVRPRALPLLTAFDTASGPQRLWTTFSADQIDLNYRNPAVLLAVLEQLLRYAAHGARFIRLDAIAYLWKTIGTTCIHLPQTHGIIRLLRAVLERAAPGVMLITETNVPHADNISYFGDGANEAHLVYNFALAPLLLHAIHTGSAAALAGWARALAPPPGQTAFFNFLASHDGIGLYPARGILAESEVEDLARRALAHGGLVSYRDNGDGTQSPYELNITLYDALSDPHAAEPPALALARFQCAQAIMLALRGMPGIYFHSLLGSGNDRAAADASGIKRRINRQKLERGALEAALNDPASRAARVFGHCAQLLRLRRDHRAFHPRGDQQVLPADERVFALLRIAPGGAERVACLHNLSSHSVAVTPGEGLWQDLGKQSESPPFDGAAGIVLQPYEAVWARLLG